MKRYIVKTDMKFADGSGCALYRGKFLSCALVKDCRLTDKFFRDNSWASRKDADKNAADFQSTLDILKNAGKATGTVEVLEIVI